MSGELHPLLRDRDHIEVQPFRLAPRRHEDFVTYEQTSIRIPSVSAEELVRIRRFELARSKEEQLPIATGHVLHGGMYARTVRLKAGIVITGALIKRATLLVIQGSVLMLLNGRLQEFEGYNIIPAAAGRKQVFVTRGDVAMTMIFPTKARTVKGAEAEFTNEAELLLSRRDPNLDTITITGE